MGAVLLCCASCTELQLQAYRNDALLESYRYALGEEYVEVDGLRLCYQDVGEGECVLIIPGLGTSADFWQLTIPALAEHYRVVAVDPPGFGKSQKPDASYELSWLVDWLAAFMDRMEIRRATVMGGSLGGHLAVLLALAEPQRVDRLVLMGSCGAWSETGILLDIAIRTLWNDALVTDHLRRNWPRIYWDIVLKRTPVSERIFAWQMAAWASPREAQLLGRAASRSLHSIFYTYTRPQIPDVQQPTLLVWGDDDRIHLLSEGIYFREHLPRSRLVVVPDSGHEVILDQPEAFNRLVLTFLRDGLDAVPDERPGL